MPEKSLRLVLDTNVLLAGIVSAASASQKILDALTARRAVPLLSPPVLPEYREVLRDADILARFRQLSIARVESVLHRLRYIGDEIDVSNVKFRFDRDPDDSMFIELAIVGNATDIVSLDQDLLSLPASHTDDAKRFRQRLPRVRVVRPDAFIRDNAEVLEMP